MKRIRFRKTYLVTGVIAMAMASAACGGDGENGGSGGAIVVEPGAGNIGEGPGVVGAVIHTPVPTEQGAPGTTPTSQPGSGITPTPPVLTTGEEGTARLVDELSSEEYPRTSARAIESEFRNEPDAAQAKIGRSFVIQGDVLTAGKDASGQPFVDFKAGAGRVSCHFEVITDAELLRFTPDGTNAVVGTVDSWDAENRVLTVRECRAVLGY